MNDTAASPSLFPTTPPTRVRQDRLFYAIAAAMLLVTVLVGFQQFFLHGRRFSPAGAVVRPLTPSLRALTIVHGIAMTSWIVLFLVQPLLVARRRLSLHRTAGKVGAVLAVLIVILDWKLAIGSALIDPQRTAPWSFIEWQFMTVTLGTLLMFAGFVTLGVLNRHRAHPHRSMMFLATLAIMPAATDRIPALLATFDHTVWGAAFGPFFPGVAFGAGAIAIRRFLTGSFERYLVTGWLVFAAIAAGLLRLAPTPAWHRISSMLLGL